MTVHDQPDQVDQVGRTDNQPDDQLLTLPEVAAIIRVPIATLRYWRHLGSGPRSFRIGRSVRYWRTDVTTWLQDQSRDPQANHTA